MSARRPSAARRLRARALAGGIRAAAGASACMGGRNGPPAGPRGLAAGARCLDAGCGPGETMRLMAQRVGPMGTSRRRRRRRARPPGAGDAARRRAPQCAFAPVDLEAGEPIPGAPFDLVYARLLLFHVADPVAVLRRLWDAVAPGGVLAVHDYDLRTTDVLPALDDARMETRRARRLHRRRSRHRHRSPLPAAVRRTPGSAAPQGTDVAGHLAPLRAAAPMFAAVFRSLLPAATARPDQRRRRRTLARGSRDDTHEHGDFAALWPLLIGAWKPKAA